MRIIFIIMIIGSIPPGYATDQLIAENSVEPNLFGYFVTVVSVFVIGSIVVLRLKNWKKRK